MSIIVSDVSYHYFNQQTLFESVCFSVSKGEKVSLIGNNGVGKSTLLKLLAGEIIPSSGNIRTKTKLYYVPQQINIAEQTIAKALGASEKLNAIDAIYAGASDQVYFDIVNDDWEIEARCYSALKLWGLQDIALDSSISLLSGGEKTKVLLAGLALHKPDIVLLDEPTNHLDLLTRKKLYNYITSTKAAFVVVSHDISLLNLLDTTYELSPKGIKLYGGNYDFYREQKTIEERALEQKIDAEQTALRFARKKAQEVRERQDRRTSQGERNKHHGSIARIVMNARGSLAENSSAKLKEKHSGIIEDTKRRLSALHEQKQNNTELKVDFENTKLHDGKVLITANNLNFGYDKDKLLWASPIDIEIRSGERIHILGNNGSGKTTFIKLLLGELPPISGEVVKSNFSYVYLDQEYKQVNQAMTILELAELYNENNLADHEIILRLNRALFPQATWDKSCLTLSGGERMRLYLCCLMIFNHMPDIFILDEPTNNLDISSLSILTSTIKNYRGTILVISHDEYFINEVGITKTLEL